MCSSNPTQKHKHKRSHNSYWTHSFVFDRWHFVYLPALMNFTICDVHVNEEYYMKTKVNFWKHSHFQLSTINGKSCCFCGLNLYPIFYSWSIKTKKASQKYGSSIATRTRGFQKTGNGNSNVCSFDFCLNIFIVHLKIEYKFFSCVFLFSISQNI